MVETLHMFSCKEKFNETDDWMRYPIISVGVKFDAAYARRMKF